MASRQPSILVIDDIRTDAESISVALEGSAEIDVRSPDDVTIDDIRHADLILVDYKLEDWPKRLEIPTEDIGLRPMDGLALVAVLRSHLAGEAGRHPQAFALYSGQLADLKGSWHVRLYSEPVIARAINLEWAFEKGVIVGGQTLSVRARTLAEAVVSLPSTWPPPESTQDVRNVVSGLLGLSDAPWVEMAWQAIVSCSPPLREISYYNEGLAFLRWFLHRVLPYPCFLLDEHHLAARLRVSLDSLRIARANDAHFAEQLAGMEYSGVLRDFLGPRWWRAGIENMLWRDLGYEAFDDAILKGKYREQLSLNLMSVDATKPVVCLGTEFDPKEEFVSEADALQIRPDGWPAFADAAWAARVDVESDETLQALVIS